MTDQPTAAVPVRLAAAILTALALVALLALGAHTPTRALRIPSPPSSDSPLPTPTSPHSPLPTSTPAPGPDVWWTWPCNTAFVPYPDGCPEFAPIARPGRPIPPPCVRTAYTETVPNDDDPRVLDAHLVCVLDHPEVSGYQHPDPWATQRVRVVRSGLDGRWRADYGAGANWDFDCGANAAPLAWAAREILNTGSLTPAELAYSAPLPDELQDLLTDASRPAAAASRRRCYLPIVERSAQ